MKNTPSAQFVVMGIAVLAFVPVLLLMDGGPDQDKPSRVAALGLPPPATATPEPTETPAPTAVKLGAVNRGLVRLSHYWPPLGGVNCARFINGVCVSKMSSDEPWEDWIDVAIACPKEWPFGTRVRLIDFDREFVCMDRGGKIVFIDGIPWIDTLTREALAPYGSIHLADIQFAR